MNLFFIIVATLLVIFGFKASVWLGILAILIVAVCSIYKYKPSYYALKGNNAFMAGDENGARELYKKAYDTGRTDIKIKTSYAYVLLRTGYADEAENVLNPIISAAGLAPEKKNLAKQQRCMVYYKQGRLDEAIEDAEAMLNEGFKTTNLYSMLGYFKLLRNDDIEETTRFCEEAYEYNSDERDIKDNLTLCYLKKDELEKAEKISDELVELAPEFVEGFYHGIQIALKLGKYDKAREYADKLENCKRSSMTTVSEEDVERLIQEVRNNNENAVS